MRQGVFGSDWSRTSRIIDLGISSRVKRKISERILKSQRYLCALGDSRGEYLANFYRRGADVAEKNYLRPSWEP